MNKKTLDQVSARTSLSVSACTDMLNAGWSYVETLSGYRWEKTEAVGTADVH
jgi:hypothetical protein